MQFRWHSRDVPENQSPERAPVRAGSSRFPLFVLLAINQKGERRATYVGGL